MQHKGKSIRPFIGSKDFHLSRQFYKDLGFKETIIFEKMSVFHSGNLSFYLQDYYAKDWIDNTMVFMEIDDVERFYKELEALNLPSKYESVRVKPISYQDWGSECFVHDPCGILWHFGEFNESIP